MICLFDLVWGTWWNYFEHFPITSSFELFSTLIDNRFRNQHQLMLLGLIVVVIMVIIIKVVLVYVCMYVVCLYVCMYVDIIIEESRWVVKKKIIITNKIIMVIITTTITIKWNPSSRMYGTLNHLLISERIYVCLFNMILLMFKSSHMLTRNKLEQFNGKIDRIKFFFLYFHKDN